MVGLEKDATKSILATNGAMGLNLIQNNH
jgi:hypothetical protein